MTDQHPITLPPELRAKWITEARSQDYCSITEQVANHAAEWGYDQRGEVNEAKLQQARDEELEACRMEIIDGAGRLFIGETSDRVELADDLRNARRPKPPWQGIGPSFMARYRLPPDWDKVKDCDFAEGDTLLEALAEARVFSISKSSNGDGWRLQEMCDGYFDVVLTPLQLYNLGAELQVLAMTSGREGISVKAELEDSND